MKRKRFLLLLLITGTIWEAYAQTEIGNLEFVENRGQWISDIKFKVKLPNSTIYLQKHGFSVLLQNPADMETLRNLMHGSISEGNSKSTANTSTAPKTSSNYLKQVQSGNGNEPGYPSQGSPNTGKQPGSTSGNINLITPGIVMHSHFYQVEFVNSSDQVEVQGEKALDTYNNYFIGNDPSKWASNCRIFQVIVYKNIYPNIDLRFYTDNDHLKYDLVIHPGADPNNVLIRYKGIDKLIVKPSELTVRTSVGDLKETIPHSYQFTDKGNLNLECSYQPAGNNTVRFHLGEYTKSSTLIIDPNLVFSTFTGSHSDNWGYTATFDQSGAFYSGSIVLNTNDNGNGFPASTGALQSLFQGGDNSDGPYQYDMAILKFSSNGVSRVYATYLGGQGDEQPHSLYADNAGNLVIAGRTDSPDFPVTTNSSGKKDVLKGNYDIVLAKLNATGTSLIGSRLIGGTANDGVNIAPKYSNDIVPMGQNSLRLNYGDDGRSEVVLDNAGNVYLASCTASTDFPYTPNAFQKSLGGHQDGVFIKTNPDLSTILTASYLGGQNDDAAFALALNPTNGNIYIAGGTSSANFPGTNNGPVISSVKNTGIDGFLSILSPDGGTLIKTSFFGTAGTEVLYGVQFDNKGFPYIMGTTTGNWNVINAAFSQSNGKQFIAKLQPDISAYIYSTVFGKGATYPDISPTAFLVDRCENVYVSGWGGGVEVEGDGRFVYSNSKTTGLTVTAGALKAVTDGSDFYFFVLKRDASVQLYGSFFGQDGGLGDHVDGGTSRYDKQGVIYEAICANCYGQGTFPTTPGTWAPKNGTAGQGCNLAAVKIAFNFAGVAADPRSFIDGRYDSMGCVPLAVTLRDTVHNAKTYVWNFGDNTGDTSSTSFQVTHTYMNAGTYLVRLIGIDSTTCNIADTAYTHIIVRTDKAILDFDITKIPPCDSLKYIYTNISTPPAGKPFSPGSFSWDFGDGSKSPGISPTTHTYLASGTYNVSLILNDTNYCNYPDTLVKPVRVAALVKAQFTVPNGCAPYTAIFNNTSLAGQSFLWDFGDGSPFSTDANPVHVYPDTGVFRVSLIVIDSNTCNVIDSASHAIEVHSLPKAEFYTTPIPPQTNTPTTFFNTSTGAIYFTWYFGDGDSTHKNALDTVIHQYELTNTYNACLIATNQFGCADTVCHPVENLINPLLDIPNAFTPGRYGLNSIVYVKGFGVISMDWRIYNRWGQLVFESNSTNYGWDGTYKGKIQPMDVYTYTLEAVFADGTKTRRTGDITLIK